MTTATLAVTSRVLILLIVPILYSSQTKSFVQPRHWEIIENIIGHHFTPEEPMTLGLLIELEAFKHTEAIQEVSGQASSEASLEAILKKVCFILRTKVLLKFMSLSLSVCATHAITFIHIRPLCRRLRIRGKRRSS